MNDSNSQTSAAAPADPASRDDISAGISEPVAWKMIENGRYQPRRIKGSCLGRELG